MESSLLNGWGIDPAYIIIALAVLTLVLLVAVLVCIGQYRKLYRRYDIFMRGKDAETLEDTIEGLINETDFLRSEDRAVKDLVKSMNKKLRASYQKTGIVRYNAFKGMGGNLSFVLKFRNCSLGLYEYRIRAELHAQQKWLLSLSEGCG